MLLNSSGEVVLRMKPQFLCVRGIYTLGTWLQVANHLARKTECAAASNQKGSPVTRNLSSACASPTACDTNVEAQDGDALERYVPSSRIKIYSGDTIVDRKSVFQGHVASVTTKDEVQDVIATLENVPKISRSTHNMTAFRIRSSQLCADKSPTLYQDNDSDGENGAGHRLQHLLELNKLENVFVMVSRWYGGIQLGPDRFKHINNAARQALISSGILAPKSETGKVATKNSRRR
eukprot:GHVQ01026775.1.p1 GENE.GHVQ01026775.1~~GHVQ01026775.1.p1  ORF type:complete len:235 (+),score=14.41 GHVQ01026775.1:539-1243(+)